MFIYFWETERQSPSWGGAERDRDTESEAGSRIWAVSTEPDVGLEPTSCEIMTWAEVGHLTDWATQVSLYWGHFKCPICFLSRLHAQCGAWTHGPEIKSQMLYWLGQPGTPNALLFNSVITNWKVHSLSYYRNPAEANYQKMNVPTAQVQEGKGSDRLSLTSVPVYANEWSSDWLNRDVSAETELDLHSLPNPKKQR